ncbi:S8 family peptidase [Calothrix sp. PCC 6303]|uniref:S8 family peptidase n=1 Tax=Calothrix sp. PCC 6303 TaxID=1170562 RepID=UPI0002A033EA|nr:S8 family serine peptidase [Calothrix sp. PCC 6303]AFZ04131.1 peptidase S8 and S53 subtilisin kexin sedolisin [Calothrix sp. PCC 6303]
MPTTPGGSLSTATDINLLSSNSLFTDRVDRLQKQDFYRFSLSSSSSFNLHLDELSADADVQLVKDGNGNGIIDSGEVIKESRLGGTSAETIALPNLDFGTYYIQVYAYGGAETNYKLTVSATSNESIPISTSGGSSRWEKGTLRADIFTYQRNSQITFISGNGNVDFGSGKRDVLNLKDAGVFRNQVTFDWATASGGGVVANPGNKSRLFDEIRLNGGDGRRILFEGIEKIEFAGGVTYDLTQQVPDNNITPVVVPNDEAFNQQWNLHITGVHNAWRFTTGSADKVLIGIEDSGLGTDSNGNIHPDLRRTFFNGNNYLDESSSYSHGTLVQSTIAARGNNQQGIAGINWSSDSYMVDVLGGDNGDYDLASATQSIIDKAVSLGRRLVINFSLVGGSSKELQNIIASNQDVLFVFAAGNDNKDSISSPGSFAQSYSNVISVGSSWGLTDWYRNAKNPGDRAYYENWWGSNYASQADINAGLRPLTLMAPTEFIAGNAERNTSGTYNFNYDNKFNGTSASTPMVSGIASLVWSANPNLSASEIKAILAETAYDLGEQGYDQYYGYGFVNADAAVRTALALARG